MPVASSEVPYSWQHCSASGIQRYECSFTWTIENFSFLTQKVGDSVESDPFQCCENSDCKWRIELFPKGQTSEDQNTTCLSLFVTTKDDATFFADYKFCLRKDNDEQFWEQQTTNSFTPSQGWTSSSMKFDKIKEDLTNDILRIHLQLTISRQTKQVLLKNRAKIMSFCSTRTIFEKHTCRWNAVNFLSLPVVDPKSVSSPLFFQNKNSKWRWYLTLKAEPTKDKIVGSQFNLGVIPMQKPDDVRCPLQYNILVKNSQYELFKTISNKLVFSHAEEWHTIGEGTEMLTHFKDGLLQVQVDILVPSHTEHFRNFTIVSHEQEVIEDFATMFQRGEHSDMTIFVDEEKIPVHKVILASRSPVFRSMLQHDTLEKLEGKIKIEDLNFQTVRHVLCFMYTNKFTAGDETSVMEVLKAAEKYQIDQLKKMCEENLILRLNTSNVSEILMCAETYQASTLKDEALHFTKLYSDDFVSSFTSMETKTT